MGQPVLHLTNVKVKNSLIFYFAISINQTSISTCYLIVLNELVTTFYSHVIIRFVDNHHTARLQNYSYNTTILYNIKSMYI